jgi:Protein of unknown function (DUF3303)
MKFILTFSVPPETRDEAMARFLEARGQLPPAVTLLGRWTQLDLCGGFVLLESEDPKALTAFAHGWSDVLELTLAPVLEDQDLADVLKRASAQMAQREGRPEGRADGAGLPQAAAIVADQELPDSTQPKAVHGDLRAEDPATALPAGRSHKRRGAQVRHEDPPVVPETTPGTTKPPYEEIA